MTLFSVVVIAVKVKCDFVYYPNSVVVIAVI